MAAEPGTKKQSRGLDTMAGHRLLYWKHMVVQGQLPWPSSADFALMVS
jgi:hypothetical protein